MAIPMARVSEADVPPYVMEGEIMLRWAIAFLVIALVAAVFGFTGIAGAATGIAQILFFIFLVLFVIALIAGRSRPPVV
jgi:uncharacterized membrane protein YtjA (UPF0391 family)